MTVLENISKNINRTNVINFLSLATLSWVFVGLFTIPKGHEVLKVLVEITAVLALLLFKFKFPALSKNQKRFLLLLAAYGTVVTISYYFHGDAKRIGKSALVFCIFYYYSAQVIKPRDLLYYSVAIGSLAAGALATYQHYTYSFRADGFTNAILFSQAMFIFLLLNVYCLNKSYSIYKKTLSLVAITACLISIYYSQTRGVWVAVALLLPALFIYSLMGSQKYNKKRYYFFSLIVVSIIAVLAIQNSSILKNKIDAGFSDLEKAQAGNYNTSWGLRLVAWKSAAISIYERPILGIGKDNFWKDKASQVDRNLSSNAALHPALAHAHNQYLQSMLMRGFPGAIVLLALLSAPLLIEKENRKERFYGFLISGAYAIYGLSDVPFEHLNTFYLYVFSMAVLINKPIPQESR